MTFDNRYTIVTMLIDINRQDWPKYKRTYDEYLTNLSHLLSLDNNIVIYIEAKGVAFVESCRKHKMDKTLIKVITMETLPVYKYYDRFVEIINSADFKKDQVDPTAPEMNNPLYNLAVHNKAYLVGEIANSNPFNSDYFMWFDAGLGHSTVKYPLAFNPKTLVNSRFDKISIIQLQTINPHYANMAFFFKSHLVVFGGGFFGGSRKAVTEYALHYDYILQKAMEHNLIDDDQSIMLMIYFDNPDLFNRTRGGWYDAITLLNG